MPQSISSLSISGYAFSDSHFEIACRETPSSIASCSCVMLREPRRYCRFSLKLMSALSSSFHIASTCDYWRLPSNSLSQTSRSTPPSCGCIAIRNQILRRNRQLRDAKLASRVFYDNRKTLEIPTIPRVSNGADDGSRTLRPPLKPCPTTIKSLKFQPFTLIGKGFNHIVFLKVLPQSYLRALAISFSTAAETVSKSLSKRSA